MPKDRSKKKKWKGATRNPLAGFRTCSLTISHYHCTIAGTLRFNELHNLKLKHCCRWLGTCSQLFMSWVFHREKRQPYGNWHGARAVTTWGFPPCSLLMLSIAVVMHFYCFPTHLPIKWGARIFQMGGGGGKASEEGKVSGGWSNATARRLSLQFVCTVSARVPQLAMSAFLMLIISLITFSL